MTFEYWCKTCELIKEDIQRIGCAKEYLKCDKCGKKMQRHYTPVEITGARVSNAEYNPAFGCVVKSDRHRKELAKQRGMIEIGSESSKSLEKFQDDHIKRISNKDYED